MVVSAPRFPLWFLILLYSQITIVHIRLRSKFCIRIPARTSRGRRKLRTLLFNWSQLVHSETQANPFSHMFFTWCNGIIFIFFSVKLCIIKYDGISENTKNTQNTNEYNHHFAIEGRTMYTKTKCDQVLCFTTESVSSVQYDSLRVDR